MSTMLREAPLPTASVTHSIRPLSAMQKQAALLLAQGRRQSDVARMLGISHETVCRWGRLPEFEAATAKAQHELIDSIRTWHLSLVGRAMERLESLLDHRTPQVQLRAAELILRPLVMPLVALKDVREPRLDEDDFQSFVRTFSEEANGGNGGAECDPRRIAAYGG